mmetsp:Transcript_89325/g.255025  ORF Transcript_89325/g.255025 Transcript_89325/m.255025 type:complete len:266 (-) Transcript_89325:457-1254(-)
MVRDWSTTQKWAMHRTWAKQAMLDKHGHMEIPVGSVPYAEIMGHVATEEVTFTSFTKSFPTAIQRARSGRSMRQEFVSDPYAYANSSGHVSYRAEMKESVRSPGGEAPPYLFSNGIPQDFKQRMVAAIGPRAQKGGERPWPYALAALDERRSPSYGVERMQMPQFYLGPAYSGSNSHYHGPAWNGLAHGRKLWYLSPPEDAYYSSKRPYDALRDGEDYMTGSRHCLQHAGDVLFVPRLWGHAVLNSATCIGCAQEYDMRNIDVKS